MKNLFLTVVGVLTFSGHDAAIFYFIAGVRMACGYCDKTKYVVLHLF